MSCKVTEDDTHFLLHCVKNKKINLFQTVNGKNVGFT